MNPLIPTLVNQGGPSKQFIPEQDTHALRAPVVTVPATLPFIPTFANVRRAPKQFIPEQVLNLPRTAVIGPVLSPFIAASFDVSRPGKQYVPDQVINVVQPAPAVPPSPLSIELSLLAAQLQQIAMILQGIAETV